MWIRGDPRERVQLRPERPERREDLLGPCVLVEHRTVDHHQLAATQEVRQLRHRRQVEHPERGGDLFGSVRGPRRPGAQHLLRVALVPHQHAGVGGRDREQPELQRGDHAEAAAASAQRPEQLRVGVGVGAHLAAVAQHQLRGRDVVGRHAELAGVPAEAAAERVPHHADVGGGPVQRGQAVRRGRLDDVLPQDAGADAGGPPLGVDVHLVHRRGAQQDRLVQGPERARVVAGALRHDPQAELGGGEHQLADLVGARRVGDRGRALVHRHVPRHARLVVPGVAGQVDRASAQPAQRLQGGGGGRLDGHR
jgi:hypothetical protein